MKWQLNINLYLFRGYTPSWAFSFIIFFIHNSIVSYPNAKMDKRFFKSWYSSSLKGSSLDGESLIFSLSHLLFSYYESSFFFFPEFAESNHFLLPHIPHMNESHDPGRPFKVAITTFAFSTSSSIATSCSFIWETRLKYDYTVFAFWIFTFFNWFLKVIFWFMFFP